jgi:hypothetical protein
MTSSKPVNIVKARLRNVGDGVLEFTDDVVKFYVETGRFRKQRKVVREISLVDVESVDRQGNGLSITWKGTTETFDIKQSSQVDAIYERITANLTKRKDETESQAADGKKQLELAQITVNAMATIDSLFNILKNLHGRVDWKLVEDNYMQSEENYGKLANQSANPLCLDVKPLSLAVQGHRAKEAAEKTFDALKALYNEFDTLVSSVNGSEQLHPNPSDAKLMIQAVYVLNDLVLGAVVGDEEITKESAELLKVLDDLAKLPGSKIDVNAVKTSVDKLCEDKEKREQLAEDVRLMLEQQLKELLPSEAGSEQPKAA